CPSEPLPHLRRPLLPYTTLFRSMTEAEFPTLADLVARWRDEEREMRAYLAGLDDAAVAGSIRYDVEDGKFRERILWHCLLHVAKDRKSTRLNSSHVSISYAVFCL